MATIEWNIEKALFDKVEGLAGVIAAIPVTSMGFPNRVFSKPANNAPWIEVSHFRNKNSRLFLADSEPVWRTGVLQVLVNYPLTNQGPKPLVELAGAIAAQFPSGLKLTTVDGLTVTIAQTPTVMTAAQINDNTWGCPVSIDYHINA